MVSRNLNPLLNQPKAWGHMIELSNKAISKTRTRPASEKGQSLAVWGPAESRSVVIQFDDRSSDFSLSRLHLYAHEIVENLLRSEALESQRRRICDFHAIR